MLSEIINLIKELEPGEYTLVDLDKNFKVRHIFREMKNQKLALQPEQRLSVYAYKFNGIA